jgi:hypothetical protein
MSLFDWISPHKKAPATAPTTPPVPAQPSPKPHAAELKAERARLRDQLHQVVRESMVRAGVLSSSYKFKVMALDPKGQQFLVLLDLAPELDTRLSTLQDIETLIASAAKSRHQITVSAVYWRCSVHTEPPPKPVEAPKPVETPKPAAKPETAHRSTPHGFEPTEIIDSRMPKPASGLAEAKTQILDDEHDHHPTPALGPTQYEDLR